MKRLTFDIQVGDNVESGDWLCETEEGKWMPMSDDEYKSKITL